MLRSKTHSAATRQPQHVAHYAEKLAEHKAREARLEERSDGDDIDERPEDIPDDVPSKATTQFSRIHIDRGVRGSRARDQHIDSGACAAKQTNDDQVRSASKRALLCRQSADRSAKVVDSRPPISAARVDTMLEYTSIEVCDARLTQQASRAQHTEQVQYETR